MQHETPTATLESVMTDTTTDSPAPIVARIRDSLLEKGIPPHKVRREIMDITGVSKQNLTHWFNGNTVYPSIEHVIQISKAHDLDLEWLILGEPNGEEDSTIVPFKPRPTKGISPVNIGHADSVVVNGGMLMEK